MNAALAIDSGSKGAILMPLFFLGLSYFTWRQRPPWALFITLFMLFFLVVEPYVFTNRNLARSEGLINSEERVELFQQQLREFRPTLPDWREIKIDDLFRGIYVNAVHVAQISSPLSGPWDGQSVRDGLSAMVPRFLDPEKADSNMGNFFAHRLGVSPEEDTMNNIAISVPFEIVGNYGFVAGILSFGVIGILWSLFVCLLLTEARLATHPLTPLCVTMLMPIEGSVGQFVNTHKDLPIALLAAWFVLLLLGRRKSSGKTALRYRTEPTA
jgi:hypothetical protein